MNGFFSIVGVVMDMSVWKITHFDSLCWLQSVKTGFGAGLILSTSID